MNTPYYSSSLPVPVAARSEAWVSGRSLAGIVGLIPTGAWMSCLLRVLWSRGLCDGSVTCPEESYRLWCVCVCVCVWSLNLSSKEVIAHGAVEPWRKSFFLLLSACCSCQNDKSAKPGNLQNSSVVSEIAERWMEKYRQLLVLVSTMLQFHWMACDVR